MSHCSLLKAVRPEQPTPVVNHFLLNKKREDCAPGGGRAPAAPAREPPIDTSSGSGGIQTYSSFVGWLSLSLLAKRFQYIYIYIYTVYM
jgi:hypothetical protein